jgi:alkylated DNA repair dioxygenase AlkB
MLSSITQLSLLSEPEVLSAPEIPGLLYLPDFITADEVATLFSFIDQQPWLTDLKRRVQHYGYRYDYTARRVDASMRIGEMPECLLRYAKRLCAAGYFLNLPDQVIVNEYLPGQGIAPHIDCIPCFGERIASVSLGSACVMEFSRGNQKISHLLEPRSLLLLAGDARYHWKHGIPSRKKDIWGGTVLLRERRVSLTFRNVLL